MSTMFEPTQDDAATEYLSSSYAFTLPDCEHPAQINNEIKTYLRVMSLAQYRPADLAR